MCGRNPRIPELLKRCPFSHPFTNATHSTAWITSRSEFTNPNGSENLQEVKNPLFSNGKTFSNGGFSPGLPSQMVDFLRVCQRVNDHPMIIWMMELVVPSQKCAQSEVAIISKRYGWSQIIHWNHQSMIIDGLNDLTQRWLLAISGSHQKRWCNSATGRPLCRNSPPRTDGARAGSQVISVIVS